MGTPWNGRTTGCPKPEKNIGWFTVGAIPIRKPACCAIKGAALRTSRTAARAAKPSFRILIKHLSKKPYLDSTLGRAMKTDLSLAELLALVEIVDEHVDRNFPGVDPPRVLREIQQKLDTVINRHRTEIDTVIQTARKRKRAMGH